MVPSGMLLALKSAGIVLTRNPSNNSSMIELCNVHLWRQEDCRMPKVNHL